MLLHALLMLPWAPVQDLAVATFQGEILLLDSSTGWIATIRGSLGSGMQGLAHDGQGLLYAPSSNGLALIHAGPWTHQWVPMLNWGVREMVFEPASGLLFFVFHPGGQGRLQTLDPASWSIATIGSFTGASIQALAFDELGQLYGYDINGPGLVRIDATTAAMTDVNPSIHDNPATQHAAAMVSLGGRRAILIGRRLWTVDLDTGETLSELGVQFSPGGIADIHAAVLMPAEGMAHARTTCAPPNANSLGWFAELRVVGSRLTALDALRIHARGIPPLSPGLLLVSRTVGSVPNVGGGAGLLCLGGSIRRIGPPVQASLYGDAQLDIGTQGVGSPAFSFQAGETWHFQLWYRDAAMGAPTTNMSSAFEVSFQ